MLEFPLVYPLTEHFAQIRALPPFYRPWWPWLWRQGIFAALFHTEIMEPHELGARGGLVTELDLLKVGGHLEGPQSKKEVLF